MGGKKILVRAIVTWGAVASAHSEFDMWLMLDEDSLILFHFLREEPCSMSVPSLALLFCV